MSAIGKDMFQTSAGLFPITTEDFLGFPQYLKLIIGRHLAVGYHNLF
jgi:hypothetical protein